MTVKTDTRPFSSRSIQSTTQDQPGESKTAEHGHGPTTTRKQQFEPVNGIDLPITFSEPGLSIDRAEDTIHEAGCGKFMCSDQAQSVKANKGQQIGPTSS